MIIIKYFEWLRFQPDVRNIVYELCDEEAKKIRELDREEAIQMIKDNHLTRVHRNIHGTIWR